MEGLLKKIWHISAECDPFAKVGGLADVVGALPKYQRKLGFNSQVILPAYQHVLSKKKATLVTKASVKFAGAELEYSVHQLDEEETQGFPVFLIQPGHHFDKPGIYSNEDGSYPFENEHHRFPAFQLCASDFVSSSNLEKGDLIHIHDHHTGLIPLIFRALYPNAPVAFAYTIHSAEYQGSFNPSVIEDLGVNLEGLSPSEYMSYGSYDINSMRAGISLSGAVTTVSPSYAKQLCADPSLSHGLHGAFVSNEAKLAGLLNGIDPEVWSPEKDKFIAFPFDKNSLQKKEQNKQALCEELGLNGDQILMVFIGRLKYEKGAQLLLDTLHNLREVEGISFVILGTGDHYFEQEFKILEENWPQANSLRSLLKFDNKMAHQLYAAGDVLLMPSLVEPCGLNQMYAMRYGTVPIVHGVGGLIDSVENWDEDAQSGSGFVFESPDWAVVASCILACKAMYGSASFEKIRTEAMIKDFSWDKAVTSYIDVYNSILKK